ncbi:GAF domain-containing protein [Flavobacterium sp. J49]|uniref:GAF domain-containing protein n=1 Tax=Flavobacterium sp. J49 TaxID=2718534 RepID=UPI0015934B1C|nr:GAF domain-containing protein [Flavobacterium sp. J49]MBF6642249.1 GAF domain-containing protein [Flavobacterium sp. J49]NIC03495.1 GAF domain-containing protein [Flavobacterium sp. J49]
MKEALRLKELYEYHILDTKPEKELDELAEIASMICNTPISMITLVDSYRTWHKSKNGMDMDEVRREDSFCQHVVNNSKEVFVVEDAQNDDKFINNPYTKGDNGIRFYAGAPLVTPKGNVLGSLCIVDTIPKKITAEQKKALQVLSKKAMDYLNARKLILLQKDNLELSALRLKKLTDEAPCVIFQLHRNKEGDLSFDFLSKGIKVLHPDLKVSALKKRPKLLFDIISPEDLPFVKESLDNSYKNLSEWNIAYRVKNKENETEWHMLKAIPETEKKGKVIWYGTIQNITNLIEYEKTIEQILFDISHVLRRPISSLIGLTKCMSDEKKLDEVLFKEYATYLKMVSDELDDFTRKINQVYIIKNKLLSGHTRDLPKAGKPKSNIIRTN